MVFFWGGSQGKDVAAYSYSSAVDDSDQAMDGHPVAASGIFLEDAKAARSSRGVLKRGRGWFLMGPASSSSLLPRLRQQPWAISL